MKKCDDEKHVDVNSISASIKPLNYYNGEMGP